MACFQPTQCLISHVLFTCPSWSILQIALRHLRTANWRWKAFYIFRQPSSRRWRRTVIRWKHGAYWTPWATTRELSSPRSGKGDILIFTYCVYRMAAFRILTPSWHICTHKHTLIRAHTRIGIHMNRLTLLFIVTQALVLKWAACTTAMLGPWQSYFLVTVFVCSASLFSADVHTSVIC